MGCGGQPARQFQVNRQRILVHQYLGRTLAEAGAIATKAAAFREAYQAVTDAGAPFVKKLPEDSPLREQLQERYSAAKACFASLDKWMARIAKDWKKPCPEKLAAQRKMLGELDQLAEACRDLVKDVDLVFKLAARLTDAVEKD